MKVSFKINDGFHSECYSEDLKVCLQINGDMVTVIVEKEPATFERKLLKEVNEGKVYKVNSTIDSLYDKKHESEDEENKTSSYNTLKEFYDQGKMIASSENSLQELGMVLDNAKVMMHRIEDNEFDKKKLEEYFNRGFKTGADLYNRLKDAETGVKKYNSRSLFTHFLHSLIGIPNAFKEYKDREKDIVTFDELDNKIYFYDRSDDKFHYLDKENKKIYEVFEKEIKEKLEDKIKFLNEFDEVERFRNAETAKARRLAKKNAVKVILNEIEQNPIVNPNEKIETEVIAAKINEKENNEEKISKENHEY